MYKKNTAGQFIYFQLVNATDGSGLTGATVAVRRCIDGTFAAGGGTVTEDTGAGSSAGFYKYAMAQADTNGDNIGLAFTATDAIPVEKTFLTTDWTAVADAILNRDMSVGTDSGSTTVRTVRQALRFLRNKWAVSAGTLTVYKENDSDASWSASVTTDNAALPIIGNDPAGP